MPTSEYNMFDLTVREVNSGAELVLDRSDTEITGGRSDSTMDLSRLGLSFTDELKRSLRYAYESYEVTLERLDDLYTRIPHGDISEIRSDVYQVMRKIRGTVSTIGRLERTGVPSRYAPSVSRPCRYVRTRREIHRQFARLASDWRAETAHESLERDKVAHPLYLRIVALGWDAVPFLVQELQSRPDCWFLALESITGADPVSRVGAKGIEQAAEVWISWWNREGKREHAERVFDRP